MAKFPPIKDYAFFVELRAKRRGDGRLRPFFDYGTAEGPWNYQGEGYESMSVASNQGGLRLDAAGNIRLGMSGVRCYGRTTLAAGESAYVTLSWGASQVPGGGKRLLRRGTRPSATGATG